LDIINAHPEMMVFSSGKVKVGNDEDGEDSGVAVKAERRSSSSSSRAVPPWKTIAPRRFTGRRSFVEPKSSCSNISRSAKAVSPYTALRATSTKPKSKAMPVPRPPSVPPPASLLGSASVEDDDDLVDDVDDDLKDEPYSDDNYDNDNHDDADVGDDYDNDDEEADNTGGNDDEDYDNTGGDDNPDDEVDENIGGGDNADNEVDDDIGGGEHIDDDDEVVILYDADDTLFEDAEITEAIFFSFIDDCCLNICQIVVTFFPHCFR
jgi:hypothetical protein